MSKATILIVEDDAILALYLQEILTRLGYTSPAPIASGEEVLASLSDRNVDLILMDIELAGTMNGITAAETINLISDIPIVFLTGFSQDPLLEQAKIAAPYGYLIKPVPERELAATIEMALHRHMLDKKLKESQVALAKSEAKYRHLFENSPLGIFRNTLDGKALLVNAEMARILGCASPEEALSEFTDLANQFYADPDRRREFISLLRENGVVNNFEYEGRKKTGETIWISTNAKSSPIGEENGESGGTVIDGFATDITVRKLAEKNLKNSQANLMEAQEIARLSRWELDLVNNHLTWSDGIFSLFEINRDEFAASYEAFLNFVHPDDRPLVDEAFRESVIRKSSYEIEHRLLMKDGRIKWVNEIGRIEYDDAGQALRSVGIVQEITERKLAEELLRESEEKHRRLFENMPEGIVYQNANDEILFANPAAERILGLTLDQMRGKTSFDPRWNAIREDGSNLPGQEHPSMVALRTGKPVDHFVMGVMKPGETAHTWISVSAIPFFRPGEKKPFQVYATFDDITEQRRAEQNYQTLFREMLNGFALHEIICDEQGTPVDYRFLAVNPAFERMTGLIDKDIVGRTVLEILPGIERHWIQTYGRVALTGQPIHFENSAADLQKHFEVTAFQPSQGQFACIFTDITERKRAEEERRQLQAQLQQAQKMEAIGTLAGGIAHDFNNILGAILGYAEMALDDCPAESMAARDIGQVVKAGYRARDLVKQILAFSRQAETRHIPLQPASIVKETVKMLRSSLPSTIDIRQDVDTDAGTILADPTQIHQILMNLCTNAYHAMEETGGTLTISLSGCSLSREDLANQAHAQPGGFIQISIADSGTGITPEILERIYDPYFTTKETGKGTGMGLAIVHGIVKNYGGFISCLSQPGEGTVFHVFLPIIAEADQPEKIQEEGLQLGNERILLIDDEEMLVEMGRIQLERLGYRVTVRTSSIEALTAFQNQPDQFDLVITDQTMPGMTGKDLARRMLQIRPDLPIILCTGFSNLISAEKARSLGIRGFALKPLATMELAALIRKVLDNGGSGVS